MRSMTGYGKGVAVNAQRTVTIELKAVNNRYLEISTRIPKGMAYADDIIRKAIQANISRGTIEVYFQYDNKSENAKIVTVDIQLARQYFNAAKSIRTEFLLGDDFSTSALMRSADVLKIETPSDDIETVAVLVKDAVSLAISELNKMRQIEGYSIKDNLCQITDNLQALLNRVKVLIPSIITETAKRLKERIEEALKGIAVDEARFLNEVAYLADKTDINEEISRLDSHLKQFKATLNEQNLQGRKLEFLSQEINREINTMGSKSNDIRLTEIVLTMKNELEKIKEQCRNVE